MNMDVNKFRKYYTIRPAKHALVSELVNGGAVSCTRDVSQLFSLALRYVTEAIAGRRLAVIGG